jgi:hypothetical protein
MHQTEFDRQDLEIAGRCFEGIIRTNLKPGPTGE